MFWENKIGKNIFTNHCWWKIFLLKKQLRSFYFGILFSLVGGRLQMSGDCWHFSGGKCLVAGGRLQVVGGQWLVAGNRWQVEVCGWQ